MSKEPVAQFKLNLPVALKERLEHAAIDNKRSVSAEIIARLEVSFDEDRVAATSMVAFRDAVMKTADQLTARKSSAANMAREFGKVLSEVIDEETKK